MPTPMPMTCGLCGRREDDPGRQLTGSRVVEGGRQRWFCGACTREHLRAFEAKLDSQYW